MRSTLLFFIAVILLTAGCNQDEGASATDGADASPAAADSVLEEPSRPDSILRIVADGVRMRIESDAQGLDAMPAEETAKSTSIMQWYEKTSFQPLWVDSNGPRGIVDQLVVALRDADDRGLSPMDYPADRIASLAQSARATDTTVIGRLVDLELLCMHAAYRYAAHLGWGRVSPGEVTPDWNEPVRKRDEQVFFRVLGRTGDLDAALSTVQPSAAPYDSLLSALQRYQRYDENGGWPTIPEGPTLKAGQIDERVPVVRERLAITGDLRIPVDSVRARIAAAEPFPQRDVTTSADSGPSSAAETIYRFDDELLEAVVRFQGRHGLDTDGAIGPSTRTAMNVPPSRRVRQIIVNLERWRWMPDNLGSRYVVVNIAGFSLDVIEDGRSVLSMRVIAGRPFHQTPVFSDEISYLVFNPYWHIPESLALNDKLPRIRRDSSYLTQQRIQVFRGWGANATRVEPATINWSAMTASNFPFRLRQDPGPWNALGHVKFMFPNPYSVYLHDTPERGLFDQSERTFSSGCIRVEKPAELAAYLLADQPEWTAERIRTVMQTGTAERAVVLNQRVPVHLQYWTAWTENGNVHFRNDVYGRDALLLEALENRRAAS